jgi:hypothetical protein
MNVSYTAVGEFSTGKQDKLCTKTKPFSINGDFGRREFEADGCGLEARPRT